MRGGQHTTRSDDTEPGLGGTTNKPPVGEMMIRLDYVSQEDVAAQLELTGDQLEREILLNIWQMMTKAHEGQPEGDGGRLGLARLRAIASARDTVLKNDKITQRNTLRRQRSALQRQRRAEEGSDRE